jgi:DNA-binding MarR family transcriptional regulator
LAFRGPFLLLYALSQQQGRLLQQAMADAPLSPADFAVYSALRYMQPTTPTQLAATLGMKPTTLSSVLVRMAETGHLMRRRNPADGRSVVVSLNAAGVRVTEACFASFGAAIQAFRRNLEVDEQDFLDHLEAASRAFDRAAGELGAGQAKAGSA